VRQPWQVYGSFGLQKNSKKTWQQLFQDAVHPHEGLQDAAGVYVICTTHGKNHKIRYVGMTHQLGFKREIFSAANQSKVWAVIENEKCSAVTIWLIAKPKSKHAGFSWHASMKVQSGYLETLFILHAKAAGHILINNKKMKATDAIAVEGLFGVKKRGRRSQSLKTLADLLVI
jgi:hypothetical protein